MATYTIAQALATNATGITVVDSPVTIATSLPNPALVARVALFTISGNSAVAAWEAEVLAGLGSQFSTGGYKLTVRDSVAALTDPANAAGLVIPGAVVAVFDTAANILAAANNSIIHNAGSIALSANATVTLAQLLTLESWSSFSAAGLTITLADTAANLLALTTAEEKPALTVFTVSVNSTVSALSAVSLGALSHFSVASGATLTIADSIANLTNLSSSLTSVLALAHVAVNVSDTVSNLLGQSVALATIRATMPSVTVSLSDTETATVSQAVALAALPGFSVSAGHALTIADSVINLLTLTTPQAAIAQFTTLRSSDTASVSQLATLAALPGFSAGSGNVLTVTGSVASLIALTAPQKALVQATTLTASDTANAAQLVGLAALPVFSRGSGHTLVVTDTLSQLGTLTTTQRALASSSVVDDTVTAILAAQTAHSTVLSAAAAVTAELDGNNITVAQLASLLTLPGLTLHPNVTSSTLTIADSVADLLTLTSGQKALVQATTLLGSDTANAAQLAQLAALPAFSRGAGHTLVVTDTLTDLGTLTPTQLALASSTVVDDTVTAILAAQTAHSTVLSAAGAVTAELDGNSITVTQLTSLLTLPGVTLHPNSTSSTLTIADSVQHLLTLTTPQKALVQATTLLASDTANAAQLAQLAALPAFSRGAGHTLVATDTIADFAALTTPQRALASSTVVDDGLTDVLAGLAAHSTVLSSASAVTVELDGTGITVAQAASLLTLPGLTLHPNVTSSVLTVADTMQNLSAGVATLTALGSDGPITLTPTNDHTILTASAAATLISLGGFNPANYTLAVADAGPALSTYASQIFGHGFEAITVTSGSFAGTLAQLLDPTLHFLGGATAQLSANASANAAQAEALAALPGFARGTGVTLSVQDSITNLVAGATTLATIATSITANDAETVSAAGAAALATLQSAVGAAHFSLGGYSLTIGDTAQDLLGASPGAISLATSLALTSDARISESAALQLAALGGKFSPSAFFITVVDTAANLVALANTPAMLAVVNGWNGGATLSADGGVNVAGAASLLQIGGFSLGTHHLTVSDTAATLLNVNNAAAIALGSTVTLSQAASVTAGNAAALAALAHFSAGGLLSIADNAVNLVAMAASVAAMSSATTLLAQPNGDTADYTLNAAQMSTLLALPHFSMSGFAGQLTVVDSAAMLAALAPTLAGLPSASQAHITSELGGDATVSAATAATLAGLPNPINGGHVLTVLDTPTALLAPANAAAFNVASVVGVSAPVTVTVAVANQLAALHGFAADTNAITIADTPANLAALSAATAAIAAQVTVLPYSAGAAADYTINTTQFGALTTLQHLSWSGFSGPLTVQDTAGNLAGLATSLAAAQPGSVLSLSHGIISTALSSNGVAIPASELQQLATLPGFSLNTHSLTVQDTPTNLLLDIAGSAVSLVSGVTLAPNSGAWVVAAAAAAQLAAMPGFNTGSAGMQVQDSAFNILAAANAGGMAAASSVMLNADATVPASQALALHALQNFSVGSHHLTINDNAFSLLTLDAGTAALASGIQLQGSATVQAAQFLTLSALPGFTTNGSSLNVSDNAAGLLTLIGHSLSQLSGTSLLYSATPVTVANAQLLSTLPNLLLGNNLAIADTAANLLLTTGGGSTPDDWAIELQASSITLTQNALLLNAAQATLLAQLGFRFSTGAFTLTVQDTPTALLTLLNVVGPISNQISATTVAPGPWTLNGLSVASELGTLPHFSAGSVVFTIADTVANLSAGANSNMINSIIAGDPNASFTLAGNDTATVAQAETLHGFGSYFSRGSSTLTIQDGAGNLATLDSGTAAMASSILLQGSTLTSVANFQKIRALPNYSNNGHTLVVSDTSTNLLKLVGTDVSLASEVMLSTSPASMSAATAEQLATLANFTTGIAHLTILDSVADLVAGSGAQPDDWAGEVAASSITLNGSGSVTAAQADVLAMLGGRFSAGGFTLTVSDSAANLLAGANAAGLALAGATALSGNESGLSAASATQLAGLTQFSKNGHSMGVSDTAANLAMSSNAAGLALANTVQLSAGASVTVAVAEALLGMGNFVPNGAAPLTIADTLENLLALAGASLAHNGSVLAATAIGLAENSVATAAQMQALAALPQYAAFSRNGHTLTVADSGANLATLTHSGVADASSVVMTGAAILTASQADGLAALPVSLNDNSLTVADTATALLNPSNTAGLAIATAITLSGATTVDAADATSLVANPLFNAGGQTFIVSDTASALLGLGAKVAAMATTLSLSESGDVVTAPQLAQLAELGGKFSLNTHTLTVSDTLTHLLALNALETALVSYEVATDSSPVVINAATATALAASAITLSGGATLVVQDTAANLAFAGYSTGLAIANVVQLSTSASLTVAAAEALIGIAQFQTNGAAPITIADTLANLLQLSGASLPHNTGILTSTPIELSENETATAAQIQALATLAQYGSFSRNGYTLNVADSGANLATLTHSGVADASSVVMTGAAILTASQADALAALPVNLNGNSLTVADTATALLSPSNTAGLAIATAITLSGATTVDAADATSLVTNPLFSAGGESFIVSDTASALLGLGAPVAAMATTLELSESGDVVTAPQLVRLAELGNKFSLNGHTLTVSDTLTHLLALNALETALVSYEVATDSSPVVVNAATATALAASAITLTGGAALVVQDTAANLAFAGNSSGLAIADTIQLSTGASLTVAAAEALIGMTHFQTNGAAPLVIADTLPNLLQLSGASLPHNTAILTTTLIELSENETATAAQIQALAALAQYTSFSRNGHTLTVADSGANLATLTHSGVADASSVVMTGAAILTASQADALAALPVSLNGNSLTVADTASALLNPSNAAGLAIATAITLSGATTVDAADATSLVANPLFSAGGESFIVRDTASALLGLGAPVAAMATTLELSESGDVVTAPQLVQLAELGNKFSLNGHTLTVSDTLTHLLALNALETALVSQEIATDSSPVVVNAATATALAASAITLTGGATLVVQDTAANLAFAGNSTGLAIANTIQLSTGASLTVAAAEALIGMTHFQTNGAAPLVIADTLPNLLQLSGASLPHNTAILTSTPIELSANATATVAQMQALAALAQYASFTMNGYTITVADSGRHLAAFTADTTAVPSAYVMIGDATLNALQANSLAAKNVDLDGNNLTLADTPAALLSGANSAGVALATALTLSGNPTNDTTDATDAMTLAANAKFSTGGHTWIISDNADNLLGLNATTEQMATTLALTTSQSVDVADLVGLTELGVKFSVAGHTLTVSDTAAQLASLNTLETALANGGETLSADVTAAAPVNAATAALLAALPAYSDNGHTLVVRDSVANLIALPAAAQAIATTVLLTPGAVTVTAAQGAALAHLANFSTSGATITVSDTIANLNDGATTAWHNITSTYTVSDSESNLLANASTTLLADASSVTLLADAQVDGATFVTLAAIHAFTHGTAVLTVVDTPAEIASLAATIATAASGARIDSPTPVSTTQANALAGLNDLGMLSFSTGVHLTVEDNYAALTDDANAAGVALASAIIVLDTAANLATAAGHDWGSATLSLLLSNTDSITGAQATILANSGVFSANGHSLVVADNAAGVVGATTAIHTLGIDAQVTDSIADVDANSAGLIALGSALASVDITDTSSVNALAAAGLSGLAALLTGHAVTVADDAADVNTSHAALVALGGHLAAVSVTDSAALVGAVSTGLLTLSGALTVHLNDGASPVSADVAAALVPLVSNLAPGTAVNVSDLGTAIAADATALRSLGNALGTVTLSDGTATNAAVAAGLVPVDSHLGNGVTVAVTDSVAGIVAVASGLTTLLHDGRLASVTASTDLATVVIAAAATLGEVGATATVTDSAADVTAHLDALDALSAGGGILRGVTLNDGGSPTVTVSVVQIATDADVLALITPFYDLTVSDTATHIRNDLIAGGRSHILSNLAVISGITAGGGTISLTEGQVNAAGVDDGAGSALSKMSGATLVVTGVAVADIDTILALGVAPASITLSDTGAAIQANLGDGASSTILLNFSKITGISVSPAATITLSEAQATYAGVATALNLASGLQSFVVTGVTVAQVGTVAALGVANTDMQVSDTASHMQTNLTLPSPTIVTDLAMITTIALSDGGTPTITLGVAQLVSDAGALAKITSTYHLAVGDSALDVQTDLASGASSNLLHPPQALSGITLTSGDTITLTESQAMFSGVSATAASITGLTSFVVTGVTVGQIATVLGLGVPNTSLTLSESVAQLLSDLNGGSSVILANLGAIGGIVLTDGGTPAITVTLAQLGADGGALAKITLPYDLTIDDSAGHIQSDLASGASSQLLHTALTVSAITVDPSGPITLTETQVSVAGVDDGAGSALAKMSGETLFVTDVLAADIGTVLGLGVVPSSITVVDSAAGILADLGLGDDSLILLHSSKITSLTPTDALLSVATATSLYNDLLGHVAFDESGLTITGSAAALLTAQSSIPLLLSNAAHVTMSDDPTGLTAAQATTLYGILGGHLAEAQTLGVADSSGQLLLLANAHGVALATSVALAAPETMNAATATELADLTGFNAAGPAITVRDTSTQLLSADNTAGIAVATTVTLNASTALTADVITQLAGLANFTVDGGHAIAAQDTAAHILAMGPSAFGLASSFVVDDTASAVQSHLDALQSAITANALPLSIDVTDGVTDTLSITVDAATYTADAATLDLIGNVTGVVRVTGDAADIAALAATLAADTMVGEVDVTDNAADQLANVTDLLTVAGKITALTPTDASLSVATATSLYNDLLGHVAFDESGLTITGSAAALLIAQGTIPLLLSNAAHVTMSDDPTGLTAAQATTLYGILGGHLAEAQTLGVADSSGQLLLLANAHGVALATSVALAAPETMNAATATELADLTGFNAAGPAITVRDTSTQLLSADNTAGIAVATTVTLNASTALTADVITQLAGLANFTVDGGHAIAAQDTAAHILAMGPSAFGLASSFVVDDTASAVQSHLDALQSAITANALPLSIDVTDGVTDTLSITVDAATYTADAATLDLIGNVTGVVRVTGDAADIAALAATLAADTMVGEVDVTDNAADQLANVTDLLTVAGKITALTPTDASLSVATATSLYNDLLGHVAFDESGLTITGSAAALLTAQSSIPLLLSNAAHVTMSDDPAGLTAAQATTLYGILGGHLAEAQTLGVADSSGQLLLLANAHGVALATSVALAAPETMNAATATELADLTGFNAAGPAITVRDTSDQLLSADNTNGIAVATTVTLNARTALTADVITQLAGLANFTVDGGHAIAAQDTAAHILAMGPSAFGLASSFVVDDTASAVQSHLDALQSAITANALPLSIDVTDGVTDTLSITVDAATYTADAATLDLIGNVTGVVRVTGDAADIAALAATLAADTMVGEVDVTDNAADQLANVTDLLTVAGKITSLTPTDALLSVATATSLYNDLLGHVAFDESGLTITGSAAALLTAQSSIPLLLSNAAHVTMSDDPTGLTAAQATTLYGILGGHLAEAQTLGVADSSGQLLLLANAHGVALATSVALAAPETMNAATATELADLTGFNAAGPAITVRDTSTQLLSADNTAGIAVATTVTLNASTALTADVITQLAGLANFTVDGGHAIAAQDTAAHILAMGPSAFGLASSFVVDDTASAVQSHLDALQSAITANALPLSIDVTDGVTDTLSITVDAATYTADAATLDLIGNVTGVVRVTGDAADIAALAATLAADTMVGEVDVTDNAADQLANVTDLLTVAGKITALTPTDASLSVATATSLYNDLLGHVAFDESGLTITGSAAALLTAQSSIPLLLSNAAHVTMSDDPTGLTAAQATTLYGILGGHLAEAQTLGVADSSGQLLLLANAHGVALATSVALAAPETMNAATATELADLAGFNAAGPAITVHDSPANLTNGSNAAGIAVATAVAPDGDYDITVGVLGELAAITTFGLNGEKLTVQDSATHITSDLTSGSSKLLADHGLIFEVTPTDTTLDVNTATAIYTPLHGAAIVFDESSLTITGTAADLLTAIAGVSTMLTDATAVTLSADATDVTAAQATTLAGQSNFSAGLYAIDVQDSPAHLIDGGNAAGLAIATAVTLNGGYAVSVATLVSLAAIDHFSRGGNVLSVGGDAADVAGLTQTQLGFTTSVAVTDNSTDVASNLDALQATVGAHGYPFTITLSDGSTGVPTITVNAATYTADRATIDAITTAGAVKVEDSAAAIAAIATELAADTVVGDVAVSDSAADVDSNLSALLGIGSKFDTVALTDSGTVSATLMAPLLTIPHLSAGSITISDTGSQISAAIAASSAAGLTFLNAHTVELSTDSVIGASDVLNLELLTTTGLQKNGFTLQVWDTAAHLTDTTDFYRQDIVAGLGSGLVDGVFLRAPGGTATISASTAASLFAIAGFSKNPPSGSPNRLVVQDTAAHLESSFAALDAHLGSIDSVVLSAAATVTDAVYGDLLTLGTTRSGGTALTVRDTAATIIADAPDQLGDSPSLTPTVWSISASATVSEAGAALLGRLPGFTAGSFTLTLDGSYSGVSVSDANLLAGMSAFHLGGYNLTVSGGVSALESLTMSARAIVIADITDSFTQIATLTTASGLLSGTITVNTSDSPSVAQVTDFLGLLQSGSNPSGIAIGNVSFGGHHEAVTDTLANLQSFTGTSIWTDNASLQTDFTLVAADTVSVLTNASNTAALHALNGTTLSGNQSTGAASAEALFALTSTIHFSIGSNQITIYDNAADILAPAYSDGVGIASALQLSGNATVAAADAETLLSDGRFTVNGHTLTISDSSDDLLDGTLAGLLDQSGLVVELSGPETLDAQTAATLVALDHFTGAGELSIQDSSSYLLNAANYTAELAATSVTLAGDETVSVATATRLAALPNFTVGTSVLHLASNDYANAASLATLADLGTGFVTDGNTLTLTQDALSLTPTEYAALQADGALPGDVVLNGHALSVLPVGVSVSSSGGLVHISGSGVSGATINVYAANGLSATHSVESGTSFSVTATDTSPGLNVVVTETVATGESAPIIALEQTILTSAASADHATFAGSGQVQVATGEFLNLYTTATAPASPTNPELVYDPTGHTLSLDFADHSTVLLVTLGAATHPASLDPSEIFVKHFS